MATEPVISARGLGKAYSLYHQRADRLKQIVWGRRRRYFEEFWALRGLDLDIARGETLGIVGENGAGKSTLLQLICGTLRPTTGTIAVRGRVAALLELGAGFNPEFTGRENVRLSAAVLGLTRAEIADRFETIAEFAGIGEFIDLPVKLYSSGMYARLAFSVCAHVDADILIVDEILAVGDTAFQQKCTRYLNRFRERGTLLFVSHNSGMVAKLCERALWLERGEMRELGPAGEVCAHYLAKQAERDEAPEGLRGAARSSRWDIPPPPPLMRDNRLRRPNRIVLRDFDTDAPWHGHGGATIDRAAFYPPNENRHRLTEMMGGDEVQLRVDCRAERTVTQPVVGFILRDRLGQNVFGDNSYLADRQTARIVEAGGSFSTTFRFQLPYLAMGDYSLTFALTEGTQDDHIQLHWVEDALVLHVIESPVGRGIVGIPAKEVRFDCLAQGAGN